MMFELDQRIQTLKPMKTDRLTKFLLSIIAGCLCLLTMDQLDLFPKAHAGQPMNLLNTQYGLVPLNEDGSITVKLSTLDEIDVNITDISTTDELRIDLSEISTSDELEVNIEEIGGQFISAGGAIPVKIRD